MLGPLTPLYVYASDYLVHPFVGWTDYRPEFHPDPYEVAKLIQAPLAEFLDPGNRREEMWQLRNRDVLVPFFDVQEQIIWGATAMILSEMLALPAMQQLPPARSERPQGTDCGCRQSASPRFPNETPTGSIRLRSLLSRRRSLLSGMRTLGKRLSNRFDLASIAATCYDLRL